jgi:hypothetical protein
VASTTRPLSMGMVVLERGDSGFDANFGGGPGFVGLDDDQRIQYSTYWRGGGDFDSPRLDPCSRRAGPFPFLTAAGVPLDAGEDDSTRHWPPIPLDAGEDQTTRLRLDSTDNRREDAVEDFLTHRRPRIPQVAVGDSSTRLRPRHPLDTASPT